MNFEHAIDEVYDPVVRDPRACICRGLPSSGDAQARLRDLDDERRARRMRLDVLTRRATDDADVRLRLGPVVEDDRTLCLNKPTLSERPLHRLRHEKHRRPVRAVLRFLHEQQPVEQLDRVVLVEEAVVDQPLVLATGPATQAGPLRLLHRSQGRSCETVMLDPGAARGVTRAEASNTSLRPYRQPKGAAESGAG